MRKQLTLTVFAVALLAYLCVGCNTNAPANNTPDEDSHHEHGMLSTGPDYADSINRQLIPKDTMKGSPHRMAMNTIGGTHVHIEYGSPGLKGRIIWGGLVPYDAVWVTGAHGATSVRFSRDVIIAGKAIKRGTYALFTIPGKESWQVILNTRYDQHLTDEYSEAEDVLRVKVNPEQHANTERLTWNVNKTSETAGEIQMTWEKIKILLPFYLN